MEIYDVLLIILLMVLISRLCDRSYLSAEPAPTAEQLTYQLNLSGLCQANAERNQKLYDDVQRYKKAEDERKKKQDELLEEQQALNNMLKIRVQTPASVNTDPWPYNNGDYAFVGGDCLDSRLTKKMISSNLNSKQSIDNRAKWNANVFAPYVRAELDEYENMIWWENDLPM